MFATFTNRGTQLLVDNDRAQCQKIADEINSRNSDIFAWVQEVHDNTPHEDMPGKGKWFD